MLFPWYSTAMLAMESNNVIALRLTKISFGGQGAVDEARTMVSEKIAASWEAATTMISGGSAFAIVARYREHVAANAVRLVSR